MLFKAAVLAILLLGVFPLARALDTEVSTRAEDVVLLHGLMRTDRAMRPMEKRLTEAGFRVHNIRYASTQKSPESLVEDLREKVAACCEDARVLHFVGHSLGGILIRAYLAAETPPQVGRVVMLAPPNHGSELVDVLVDSALFRWAVGPTGQQLGTDPGSLPNRLPPPTVELGVVAGTSTVNPLASAIIPGEDDGTVAVVRTELDGMTDYILVATSHTFIMRSEKVSAQVVHFLRHGRFLHEATHQRRDQEKSS